MTQISPLFIVLSGDVFRCILSLIQLTKIFFLVYYFIYTYTEVLEYTRIHAFGYIENNTYF